jgi:hypothetical protein
MFDDDEIDQLFRSDVPAEDGGARERARIRLRSAMDRTHPSPRPIVRVLGLTAAISALVLALVTLQTLLPLGRGGPEMTAAAELSRLGRLSTTLPVLEMSDSDVLYREYVAVKRESYSTGARYELLLRVRVEMWIASDGSGRRDTIYESVVFATPGDRENWVAGGSPPIPSVGTTDHERFASGDLVHYDLEQLPTEPAALRDTLISGESIPTAAGEEGLLSSIGVLLAQEELQPALRQSLFEVAGTLRSVEVRSDALDPLGRPAVAVVAPEVSGGTTLYFDAGTARFLARATEVPGASGRPSSTSWTAYVSSGLVPDIGARP